MQKPHFLNSLDFSLVVSIFVVVCNDIFSNIKVKLNSLLRKRSVTVQYIFLLQKVSISHWVFLMFFQFVTIR